MATISITNNEPMAGPPDSGLLTTWDGALTPLGATRKSGDQDIVIQYDDPSGAISEDLARSIVCQDGWSANVYP